MFHTPWALTPLPCTAFPAVTKIYCYLSQGPFEFMTYTVNAEKYRCVKYQYQCRADTAATCTQAQIQVGAY
jgi:hypothetical protein